MRHLLLLATVGLSLVNSGCFIFEELQNGVDTMNKHSPPPKVEEGKVEADSGLSFAALQKRGKDALGELSGKVDEVMQKEPDPNNAVIKCGIDGRVEYTRKFDCQSRGGRIR